MNAIELLATLLLALMGCAVLLIFFTFAWP